MKKIAIIGHFGGEENFLDGQTVKTKILYDELQKATDWEILKVDTYYKKKHPFRLLFRSLKVLLSVKDVIVLLSSPGRRFYFPLLYLFHKMFGLRVYHDVIGGALDNFVSRSPKQKKYLQSFVVNWVETQKLKKQLEKQGITNCEVIPNFKRLNLLDENKLQLHFEEPFRFCTFSRVVKEKGIETAIEAIEKINEKYGRQVCKLDIYGPIDEKYEEDFQKVMKGVSSAVSYRGKVDFHSSVDVISGYYALLFPTYWDGEGFPGTVVDAFSSGLPVIATDWNCNAEVIEDGKSGIVYPNDKFVDLQSAVEWAINNVDKISEMKKYCLQCAEKYQPDEWIKKMVRFIEENGK